MSKRNPLNLSSAPLKACADLMRQVSYRHRIHQVFADFCEMSAISISNAVDIGRREAREARYLQIASRYERSELEQFPRMLAHLVEGLEAGPCDFLGELFMGLELGNHWVGQFFTPYPVASMMARMNASHLTPEAVHELGGFVTVNEPACGAGGMVIAFAEALQSQGVNYQRCMHATLQDLDVTAVHMAYLQASLMYVPAIVIQGNTLALEERDHWVTPAHVLGGWDRKLARRAAAHRAAAAAYTEAAPAAPAEPLVPSQELAVARDRIAVRRLSSDQLALF